MEITARQLGHLEAILEAHPAKTPESEKLHTLFESTLEDIRRTAYPGELTAAIPPEDAVPSRREMIDDIRRELHSVDGLPLAAQIKYILNTFEFEQQELAALMDLHPSRICEALRGFATKSFVARFAELFGDDCGALPLEDKEA